MKLTEFTYVLPQKLIAQYPLKNRAEARLLVLDRNTKKINHHTFSDIVRYFKRGDVLVLNNTKVFKARLQGRKKTGGKIEILLLKEQDHNTWNAMLSPAKRIRENMDILLDDSIHATVITKKGNRCTLTFNTPIEDTIKKYGHVPLPHYIKRKPTTEDESSYQTVFAKKVGAIAAPTAGLHFTSTVLEQIQKKGVLVAEITLHIGPGTFKTITTEQIEEHTMEPEFFEISSTTLQQIRDARRVFAVGTSVCRSLETYAQTGKTNGFAHLFIYPGHTFKIIDCLLTNFHMPCSTPLLLVSAFADKDSILKVYKEAIQQKYRFLSYGDAMLII